MRDINVLLEAIAEIRCSRLSVSDKSTVKNQTVLPSAISVLIMNISRRSVLLIIFLVLCLASTSMPEVPLPGGCNIGSRRIDQHLKGFRALGADVDIRHGAIVAKAENLHGSHIFLDVVSVGATINIMMAASMAAGRTIIENAAREPSCC